jgi:hypothetical protein
MTATTAAVAVVHPTDIPPVATAAPQMSDPDSGVRFPIEAVAGGLMLLGILVYLGLYMRGVSGAERYARGFVVDTCPVCRRGQMLVETRQERWFGIPRARHIVRCTECRSVLRETGYRRWRYAVDPMANPTIYQHYNGQEVDEETLNLLPSNPPDPAGDPRAPVTPPSFVDDDES